MPVGWSFAPVRFTPTRVGTMGAPRSPLTSPTVHPHARGDDPYSAAVSVVVFGSPPRAWGRCASCPASSTWPTVHPHARGDDASRSCGPDVQNGSPPRAWGRCWRSGCRPGRRTVHPHARGDDRGGTGSRSMKYGSPPRAWGRFERLGQGGAERRFTPTRVGTILKKSCIYGTRTRKSPSKSSTERAVSPQLRIRKPCSLSLVYNITQPPPLAWLRAFSQSLSRTIAETLPTKTPAFGSRNHRVNSPRNPVGTRSRIRTIIVSLRFIIFQRIGAPALHFTCHGIP